MKADNLTYCAAVAMVPQTKYGSGVPFYRLENLEKAAGDPVTGQYTVGPEWKKRRKSSSRRETS